MVEHLSEDPYTLCLLHTLEDRYSVHLFLLVLLEEVHLSGIVLVELLLETVLGEVDELEARQTELG
jgi:hypothetical protein